MRVQEFRGFSMPFFDLDGNPLPRQEGERLLKNDLLLLLLTLYGERVMRSGYGTAIKATPFDQMNEMDEEELKADIIQSISTNDPRFEVESIDLQFNEDTHVLNIKLQARIVNDPQTTIDVETNITV